MYNPREKVIVIILAAALIFSMLTIMAFSEKEPSVSARAAVLYEPESETFLYTKNPNERLGMASTTKIMTALVALENIETNKIVEIDDRAIGIDGSSVYLEKGEIMTAEGLLYALMLRSANDAAAALAYEISGSIEGFAQLMNEKAAEIGLADSNFENPHGLDSPNHYTSAHDLAILTSFALKNPEFKKISSTYKKTVESSKQERLLVNHNKLIKMYDGCIGVKTGYTKKCGRSLVGAAEKNSLTLISVTLDAPNDWTDHKRLLDYGYSRISAKILITDNEYQEIVPVIDGKCEKIAVRNRDSIKIIYEGSDPEITREIKLDRYLTAPIKSGDAVGEILFKKDGTIIAKTDIIATEDSEKEAKKRFFEFL